MIKQSKFDTNASHLTYIHKWDIVSYNAFARGQQRDYEMFYSTQTRRDDLLFTSMIDPFY